MEPEGRKEMNEVFSLLDTLKSNQGDAVKSIEKYIKRLGAVSEDHYRRFQQKATELDKLNAAVNETAMLAYTDPNGCILEVNEMFTGKTGYTPEELRGKSMDIFDAGQHSPEFYGHLWMTISSGKIWKGEVCKKTKTGEELWLKTTIVPVKNGEGETIQFISLYVDITQRKRIEEELEMFLSLLNFSNDAVQVARMDGSIVYVNERACLNLGYSKEELIAKRVWELEQVFSDHADWLAHIEEVRKFPGGLLAEGINIRKDGSCFPVEVNVRYFEQGNEPYIIAVLRDVTERRRNESAMEKNKALLDEAQKIAGICSYETNILTGEISWTDNAEDVFGIKGITSLGRDAILPYIHPDDRERVVTNFNGSVITGEQFEMEYRLLVPGKELQYIHFINHPQKETDGTFYRSVGTAQNVTETVKARNQLRSYTAELEKRNRELDQFAQIVSHDLKAPLRAIHNISDWIVEENPGLNQGITQQLRLLQKRVERMEYLINGILNYSEAGRKKEPMRAFPSARVLREIADLISGVENVHFTFGDLPEIVEDKLVFEQVMSNVISNAIKHNFSEEKKVIITAVTSDKGTSFCIEDNGPGIHSDYHEKVFRIFQTLLPRDKMENTGVGLAIVKKLCDDSLWQVSISEGKEKGTCFNIFIPLQEIA